MVCSDFATWRKTDNSLLRNAAEFVDYDAEGSDRRLYNVWLEKDRNFEARRIDNLLYGYTKIVSYEQANAYLDQSYLAEHNRRCARPDAQEADYKRRRPTERQLDEVSLAVEERVVSEALALVRLEAGSHGSHSRDLWSAGILPATASTGV